MAHRQTPRQTDRDVRLHDPHPAHAHSLPPHPHMNGTGLPVTPGVLPAFPPPAQLVASPVSAAASNGVVVPPSIQKLARANEETWLMIGRVAEQMGNLEHALSAYENALRHNPMSLSGLTQVAGIARIKENYPKAVEFFQRVLGMQQDNGEVWSALGHCYLMQDDLQKAYAAYQQALYLLPNPKEDPKLWYGIGILYDRYGSLDHAEEAFASVLKMDKDFDKANEILFRLGIIYKQQGKYNESLECFDRILRNPPNPLAHADIWFQIGHVYEQQRDHLRAREAYERVVAENPGHAKVLQQLGWLYHQDGSSFQNQDSAITFLTRSLEADPADAQSWYLLGRAYMAGQKYNKAYEAYQQAVYRDGRNPTFWCSIGVLYFQINQYRDALDAYSRAIRINPYISEVWFDLGSLYESCNNQISDAIDAYARAAELDPTNNAIAQRLQLLKTAQATGGALPAAPGPQDVHPTAYANPMMPPPGLSGPPLMLQPRAGGQPIFRSDSRGPNNELPLPIPTQLNGGRSSPGPFRGGPPPPVVLDDNRHAPSIAPLAPMDVDRQPPNGPLPYPGSREGASRGLANQSLLLHHPVPQLQVEGRGPSHGRPHPQEPFSRRMPSTSASPPPHASRPRSTVEHLAPYEGRPPMGPTQTPHRSPVMYTREAPQLDRDQQQGWDRRGPPNDQRVDWGRRPGPEYPPHPQQQQQPQYYGSRPHSPPPLRHAHSPPIKGGERTPVETSPRSGHPNAFARQPYWDSQSAGPSSAGPGRTSSPRAPPHEAMYEQAAARRYDPRFDAREPQPREIERDAMVVDQRGDPRYAPGTDMARRGPQPPSYVSSSVRQSQSPHLQPQTPGAVDMKDRRRRMTKDKEPEPAVPAPPPAPPVEPVKKERKRRAATKRVKEEPTRQETPGSYSGGPPFRPSKNGTPEPASSNGSGSGSTASRSVQPSPTSSVHVVPAREVDEDYDEGVAETLIGLAQCRAPAPDARGLPPPSSGGSIHSPSVRRMSTSSSSHVMGERGGSTASRNSPTSNKRPLSAGPEDHPDTKRTRVGSINRRPSPPTSSARPSPIPFRHQPTSHSPETRQVVDNSYSPSPLLPTMLPPHPRPIGAGLSGHAGGGGGPTLPPITTRTPPAVSPTEERTHSRSTSPPRGKVHGAGSPMKTTPSPSSSHHSRASGS